MGLDLDLDLDMEMEMIIFEVILLAEIRLTGNRAEVIVTGESECFYCIYVHAMSHLDCQSFFFPFL